MSSATLEKPEKPEETVEGEEKKKKTKTTKPKHPDVLKALENDGKGITEIPKDFIIGGKYQHIREDDVDPAKIDIFFDFQAVYLHGRADELTAKADSWRKIGNIGDRKTAMKVLRIKAEMVKLIAVLAAQNTDLSGILTPEEIAAALKPEE